MNAAIDLTYSHVLKTRLKPLINVAIKTLLIPLINVAIDAFFQT